jgi:hypothetical protein
MATLAHARAMRGVTPEHALDEIFKERRNKRTMAIAGVVGGLLLVLGFAYVSYEDVPAPTNPANAEPGVVTPYGY